MMDEARMAEERWKRMQKRVWTVLLMGLLMGCSYLGAGRGYDEKAVFDSLPVTRTILGGDSDFTDAGTGLNAVRERLDQSRRQELELLQQVIESGTDPQTVQYACDQKTEIAGRMEKEALACAVLTALGYEKYAASCGAGILTIFIPETTDINEEQTTSLIGAVAEQTGIEPHNIKIILAKNET